MDLNEFVEKFRVIKNSGSIPSIRRGPTGVGHTIEEHGKCHKKYGSYDKDGRLGLYYHGGHWRGCLRVGHW